MLADRKSPMMASVLHFHSKLTPKVVAKPAQREWLSEEAEQIPEKRRDAKGKAEREIHVYLNAEFQRIARKGKKAFLSDQCKEIEGNIERERLEISSRKLEEPRELFMQR